MKIGEPVHAAREGLVFIVIDWFSEGKKKKELTKKANKIVILHSDGTIGSYAHLSKNGVTVQEGDYVKKGQHIGYSGNTGFTGGPHLHFTVRKEKDESIPIYFEEYPGEVLMKGKYYTSQ